MSTAHAPHTGPAMSRLRDFFRQRFELVEDEPGTVLVLLIAVTFVLFSPGGACNYDATPEHLPASAHDGDAHH